MKKQNPINKLLSLITPYFMLAIMMVLFILMFFIFSYVFIVIIIIALIFAGIGYCRVRFFKVPQKQDNAIHKGRIIEQEKD